MALVRIREEIDIQVIVAENSDSPRCAELLARVTEGIEPGRLSYVHLGSQNVALARNAALRVATGKWVAFVDDDEIPERGWLAALVDAGERFGADGVLGPIIAEYPPNTPRWIVNCGVFRRMRFETGSAIPPAHLRTGNLLLRRDLCGSDDVWFDEAFGATGGEDFEFLGRLARAGAAFVWCDEARVVEHLEAHNLSARAVTLRAIAAGQSYARQTFRRFGLMGRLWMATAGLGGIAARGLAGTFCFVVSRSRGIKLLLAAAGDLGKVMAIIGVRYERFQGRWRLA